MINGVIDVHAAPVSMISSSRVPTCDASGGQGQAEGYVVLVVAHLSQELKLQLTQHLAQKKQNGVLRHFYLTMKQLKKVVPICLYGTCTVMGHNSNLNNFIMDTKYMSIYIELIYSVRLFLDKLTITSSSFVCVLPCCLSQ